MDKLIISDTSCLIGFRLSDKMLDKLIEIYGSK